MQIATHTLRAAALCTLLAVATLIAAAPGQAQQIDPKAVQMPEMTPRLNLGRMSYNHFCADCHGENLSGTDKGPTFLHRVYHPGHHGDAAFYVAPKQGVRAHHWKFGDMPPVPDITDAHIQAIVEYVRAVQRANGLF